MDTANLHKTYERALNDIESHALKPAFDKIRLILQTCENWDLLGKADEIEQNYRYMLSYLIDGVEDKERERVYNSIMVSSFQLADDVIRHVQARNAPNLYYEKSRACQSAPLPEIGEITERLLLSAVDECEAEQNAALLFDACWLSNRIQSDARNKISAFFHHPDAKIYHKQLLLSALMLGCFEYFDETKIILLIDACLEETPEIRQQALVYTLLLISRYEKRVSYYATLTRELEALCQQSWFAGNARAIAMRFILSRQTEKINRDLNQKFRKHMDEIKPFIEMQMKESKFLSEPDELFDEKNPEWEKNLNNKEIEKLMDDIANMQTEGVDLMASTFGQLKHFSFFNTLSNWFLPYYSNHSTIRSLKNNNEDILKIGPLICDSDKYSLMFASNHIEMSFFDMIRQQIEANREAVEEQQEEFNFLHDPAKKASAIATLCIHNLYRFFKYYPRHLDFYDPFRFPLDIYRTKQLKEYVGDVESLSLFSDYYMRKDLYSEAIPLLLDLVGQNQPQAEYFQKLGFCYQMDEQFDAAIDAYLKADLILPDHLWTIKKLAACYRQAKQPEKALAYYQKLDVLQPESSSVALNIGHLLLDLNRPEEALKHYFKVEFNDKNGEKARRPIAWASLLAGKHEQAQRYYISILSSTPTPTDRLNAGHAWIVCGNIRKGIDHYLKCIEASSLDDFLKLYADDCPVLLRLNVEEMLINAIRDQIIYTVKG